MAARKTAKKDNSQEELLLALDLLEKEKGISKDVIIEAIENSLVAACKKDFGKADNVVVNMNRENGDITVYAEKTVVNQVEDTMEQINLEQARMMDSSYELGDIVRIEITPKNFGRIAAQHARSVIVQKIKEEERKAVYNHFYAKEKDIITGVVQRYVGSNVSISLDNKIDALLMESEQIKGERFVPTQRIKVYIVEVKDTNKGARILISRTHPDLVKRLFEREVSEIQDGVVEIKSISREAGSRTKMAVYSVDENVDPVGACVGVNGARVNAIVEDLNGEKIDIISWDENPEVFIEHALSPSKVISVIVNMKEKSAKVVVPDNQLSLAIGKEGQNARLAARLTGYKIDIKSESQAPEDFYERDENSYVAEEDVIDIVEDIAEDNFDNQYDNFDGYEDKYEDEYEDEYDDEYEDEYDDEYEDEYDDEYEDEYDDEYEDEYDDEYEDEYDDEYEDEYDDEYEDEYEDYDDDAVEEKDNREDDDK